MKFSETLGRTVLDTSSAKTIGSVDGFIVDPASSAIVSLIIKGGDHDLLPWSSLESFGDDAVTVSSGDTLVETDELTKPWVKGKIDLLGSLTLTERGDELGEITDVEFGEDGGLTRIHLGDESVAARRLLGVGRYAAVLSSPAYDTSAQPSASDYSELTKAELYELAQDQDLAGRSSMTKDELVDALT